LTRAILRVRYAHFRHWRIGRDLPIHCRGLGLDQIRVQLRVLANTQQGEAEVLRLRKYAEAAVAAGAIVPGDAKSWLEQLRSASRRGGYRHAVVVFVVSALKPVVTQAPIGSTPAQPWPNGFPTESAYDDGIGHRVKSLGNNASTNAQQRWRP
jgi:hypothetical protein